MPNKNMLYRMRKLVCRIGSLAGRLAAAVLKSIGGLILAVLFFETAIAITDKLLRSFERRRGG